MVDVNLLFRVNPDKFKKIAKDKTFEEFVDYLSRQDNFKVMEFMTQKDKLELYLLSLGH